MNLNERFDVRPEKVAELRARIEALGIDVGQIEESFVRGGGPGGQKINKTASCVVLRYAPLDLVVRCQRERKRTVNRFIALREMVDRIERAQKGGEDPASPRGLRTERRRRNKSRARRRSQAKHRAAAERRAGEQSGEQSASGSESGSESGSDS